jgi:hypothetical protein
LLVHEKVQQQTEKELLDYEKLLKSRTLFPKELISKLTSIKQLLSPGQVLKEEVIDWMVNYTVEPSSALSMVQLVKTVSTYICKMIVKHWREEQQSLPARTKNCITKNHYRTFCTTPAIFHCIQCCWMPISIRTRTKRMQEPIKKKTKFP